MRICHQSTSWRRIEGLHPFQILWSDGLGRKERKGAEEGVFDVRAQ